MNAAPRTRDDLLLALAACALGIVVLVGAAVWLAAQFVVLVHEHRLLTEQSGSILELGLRLVEAPLDPSRAFAPADRAALPAGLGLYLNAIPLLVSLVALLLRAWQRFGVAGFVRDKKDGRFASSGDVRRLKVPHRRVPGRLVLGSAHGALIAIEHHHSVVIFGPTGSGKTTRVVIPALRNHNGPAVALSVKSDLVRATHAARARYGPVFVYDPFGVTGRERVSWTPLRACATWGEAQRMADALTSAVGDTGLSESRFWDSMASKMLEPLLHAAALADLTMRDVVRWVDSREVDDVVNILEAAGASDALQSFHASQKRDPRTLSSVYASTEMLLRAYASPEMADHPPSTSFDPATLLAERGTLFICAPQDEQARLRPVFAALVKDVYRTASLHAERTGKPLDPSLLLVLDEAANIAPIHDLAQIAATCRAYAIQLVTVFQDLAQVQARYKREAQTVVNNHTAKLVLPGTFDRELLDQATRVLGEETTEQTTHASSPAGVSQSTQLRQRPLIGMHQLRQLARDRALLLYGNLPPILVTIHPDRPDHDNDAEGHAA